MEMEIDRAEQFYREAAELPRWLHKDGHRIFGLMMETYHALLQAIRRHPADVFTPPRSRQPLEEVVAGRTVGHLCRFAAWTDRKMNEYQPGAKINHVGWTKSVWMRSNSARNGLKPILIEEFHAGVMEAVP